MAIHLFYFWYRELFELNESSHHHAPFLCGSMNTSGYASCLMRPTISLCVKYFSAL
uniref:Uncharacterized protein n=1 Tax=mine drainage metagenome TaxID=410659 RepID=E6QU93_9ZZZZ